MALLVKNPSISTYFSSLSPLSQKLFDEIEELKKCEVWESLSIKEKENLVDNFFIPKEQGFHSDEEETIDAFNLHKIKCGEKIVVDFENEDGWTWRDEHSGPFSWMTRSQQDLTLDAIYQDATTDKKGQSKSALVAVDSNEQYAKAFDEPAFQTTVTNEMSEIEAAFQKFGISIPTDDDVPDEVTGDAIDHVDIVIRDAPSREVGDYAVDIGSDSPFDISSSDKPHDSSDDTGCKESSDWSASSASSSPEHTQTKSARRSFNNLLRWPWGKKKGSHKSDTAFMSLPLAADDPSTQQGLVGHVSPVFENDDSLTVITSQPTKSVDTPVETYDNVTSPAAYDTFGDVQAEERETYDNVPEDDVHLNIISSPQTVPYVSLEWGDGGQEVTGGDHTVYIEPAGESVDVAEPESETPGESAILSTKSGFDFLDNW